MKRLRAENIDRCVSNCNKTWKKIYKKDRQFSNEQQISDYFNELEEELRREMKNQENPIEESYVSTLVCRQQINILSNFIKVLG